MITKHEDHKKAIQLRKLGKSYSEIMSEIRVSQATLSLWLRGISLTEEQKSRLSLKKLEGQRKGGFAKKSFREHQEALIIKKASCEIEKISKRELWLLGIIAYWCEGSKQKEGNVSQSVVFANSDHFLLRLFVKWVKECCFIDDKNIIYTLCIHETADVPSALKYWSQVLRIHVTSFSKTSIKRHNVLTKRRNVGDSYHGLVRITIRKSTNLNRKIKGWIRGMDLSIN